MSRVFVAMSGGVDSSVAAAILADRGEDVVATISRRQVGEAGRRVLQRLLRALLGVDAYTIAEIDELGELLGYSVRRDHDRIGVLPGPLRHRLVPEHAGRAHRAVIHRARGGPRGGAIPDHGKGTRQPSRPVASSMVVSRPARR